MNTPKFKEGDWIKSIHSGRTARVVMLLKTCYSLRFSNDDSYCIWFSNDDSYCLDYSYQDNWELTDAPPKTKLEEAAEKFVYDWAGLSPTERRIAERAYLAGAGWQAERLLKGSPMPEDTVIFQKGIEEGKRLMMEEAVEGEVCGRVRDHINVRFADGVSKYLEPKNISHIPADVSKYAIGDKVKIIIVPDKEDKK